MTGKGEAFIQSSVAVYAVKPGEDPKKKADEARKEVTATAFKLGEKQGIVVVFPADTFKVEDALAVIGRTAAVEGVLSWTDERLLIAVAGAKGEKRVPMLVAEKVVRLDEKSKGRYPAVNHAVIEGKAVKGAVKAGTESFEWSIQNGDEKIPLTLPKGGKQPEAGSRVRASGKVRVSGGQLVIDAAKVESVKK
jgi:hypothetical protein